MRQPAADCVLPPAEPTWPAIPAPHPLAGPAAPTAEQVRRQLARILESRAFPTAQRARRFLAYIVEQALAGQSRRLKQYAIATEALGRDEGFNPEADPVVRLEAGKLRRALEMYYVSDGARDPVRISVPKGSYAPVFELARPEAAPTRPGLLPARPANGDLDPRRLVVLPFGWQPGATACEALAGDLLEQFTVEIARYRDLKVIAADTLDLPAAPPPNPVEIGAAIEARFALSGSVRQSGGRMRVTSRLHDVSSRTILWAESYDLDADAPDLAAQDAIARDAAGAIADFYGVISHVLSVQSVHAPGRPWSAQDAIHRHRYLARTLTEPVYRLSRRDLELGILRAPDDAIVWAALAHCIFYGNVLGFDEDADWMALVQRHVERSFELDHKNAFGYVVTALQQLYAQQFDDVFETAGRILEANPYAPSSKLSAGFFRALAGDWEGGGRMLRAALGTLLHPPAWAWRVTFLDRYRQGDYARALAEVNRYHAPDNFTPAVLRTAALTRLGRLGEARGVAREVRRLCPRFHAIEARYLRYLAPCDALAEDIRIGLRPTGLLDAP